MEGERKKNGGCVRTSNRGGENTIKVGRYMSGNVMMKPLIMCNLLYSNQKQTKNIFHHSLLLCLQPIACSQLYVCVCVCVCVHACASLSLPPSL
jgi:hypothetical protein